MKSELESHLQQLRAVLEHIAPVDDQGWSLIAANASTINLDPNDFFLRPGDTPLLAAFVVTGCVREFWIDVEGNEATRGFSTSGELSGSLSDLLTGEPSTSAIQAVVHSRLITIPFGLLDNAAETNPSLMRLLRRIAERLYIRKSRRERQMLTLSAQERYRLFVHEYPALEKVLPRHMVASYLGITTVHLGRIRSAGE